MFTLSTQGFLQTACHSMLSKWTLYFSLLANAYVTFLMTYMHVDVAGCNIPVTDSLHTLGITLDSTLSVDSHVWQLCKQSHFHLRALRHIRHCLTTDMANAAAVAIVQSRLDCANSLLYGTSSSNIHKLQCFQDTLSHLTIKQCNISSADRRYNLHWLPVHLHINCNLALPTYQTIVM
jgi:hypothetical protein